MSGGTPRPATRNSIDGLTSASFTGRTLGPVPARYRQTQSPSSLLTDLLPCRQRGLVGPRGSFCRFLPPYRFPKRSGVRERTGRPIHPITWGFGTA